MAKVKVGDILGLIGCAIAAFFLFIVLPVIVIGVCLIPFILFAAAI